VAEGDDNVDTNLADQNADKPGIEFDNNPFPNTDGAVDPDPGGTLSTANELQEDARRRRGRIHLPEWTDAITRWNAYKQEVYEDTGIRFGGSYGLLGQAYSQSNIDDSRALSHKFAFNVSAELLGRGTADVGVLNLTIEDRRSLGGDLFPLAGGVAAGSIVPTTATWSDFGFGITQFYWGQRLFKNRLKFDIGRVFAPNYIDVYPFFDDNRQFFNQTFSTSPTTAAPLRGAGAVANFYVTDNFYVRGGIYNANSENTSSTFSNLLDNWETFQHVEFGWTGNAFRPTSFVGTTTSDTDNVHITLWDKDNQVERGIPSSRGVAFNANFLIDDKVMPFLRAGWSDGDATFVDANVTAGFGLRPFGRQADLLGFGGGWARPSSRAQAPAGGTLRDQYTFELFYRLEVIDNVAVTPDIQLIINPSLRPSADTLWVGGLRIRATF